MKILMFTAEYPPDNKSAPASYAGELATALAGQDSDVHVITPQGEAPHPAGGKVFVHNAKKAIPLRHYDWVGGTILDNAHMLEDAIAVADKYGPFDVIVGIGWHAGLAAKSLKTISKRPLAIVMRTTESGKRDAGISPHQKYIGEMEAWILSHADCIVATDQFVAGELNRYCGIPGSRINIVPCGIKATEAAQSLEASSLCSWESSAKLFLKTMRNIAASK